MRYSFGVKKKVVIAMSGGIDSSVAAALLKDQGFDCTGMYMQFWNDSVAAKCGKSPQNKCCTAESLEDARSVAAKLNMPFYVSNAVAEFKKKVVDYFLKVYSKGGTPNPCIRCNEHIKFGYLLRKALDLGADFLATGHYAKNILTDGKFEIHAAKDKEKDQSYFLYRLNQTKLKHVIFPLGDLLKSEIYRIAKKKSFHRVAQKKESQGLCFFPEITPANFLQRHLDRKFWKPGPIISTKGKVIGKHAGLPFYTIGQRRGIGIGGISGEKESEGWYVAGIDRAKNALIVGSKKDVFRDSFVCEDLSFISGKIPSGKMRVSVRVRHRAEKVPAILTIKEKKAYVSAEMPVKAISEGQSAVFYQGDKMLGGGIISND